MSKPIWLMKSMTYLYSKYNEVESGIREITLDFNRWVSEEKIPDIKDLRIKIFDNTTGTGGVIILSALYKHK